MSYLQFGVNQGEGFIVITGSVGTGKSTLVRQLFAELDPKQVVASQIVTTQIEATGVLKLILSAFGLPASSNDKASMLQAFQTFLLQQSRQRRRVLLVVDEAQNLPLRTLEELRMLSNFVLDGESLFQSFLLGQPQFNVLLADPQLEQLRQRVIASYHLEPMSAFETQEYIEHRLHRVGWTGKPTLTAEAYQKVYTETGGTPRLINNLCNRVLMYGALEGLMTIDAAVVDEVVADHRREVTEGVAVGQTVLSVTDHGGRAKTPQSRPNGSAEMSPRLDRIERNLEQHERAIQTLLKSAVAILMSIRSSGEEDNPTDGNQSGAGS